MNQSPANLRWIRPCSGGDCVLVARDGDRVHVRDSKLGEASLTLTYTLAEWQSAVVADIRDGGWLPEYSHRDPDDAETVVLRRRPGYSPCLRFSAAEWGPFVDRVRAGDFDPDRLAV